MSSYLADVKQEICDLSDKLAADIEEDLGEIEGLDDLFTSYKNSLWKVVEKQLKQSFQNGKSSGNGGEKRPRLKRRPS